MNKYLTIDIGGTEIKYALMSEKAEIELRGKLKTPKDSKESFVEAIGSIYDKFSSKIQGMAISMPGVIDSKNGFAVHGGALTYIKNCNIVELLKQRCNTNIHIQNDGKSAALGEYWQGSLKNCENGIVIVIGTAIGGGIIANGKLLKGNHFSAGEFSMIMTNNEEAQNLKNLFAGENGVSALINSYAKIKNIESSELNGVVFFDKVNSGEQEAINVLEEYTYRLAIQIMNLQNIIDPKVIAIGGGISAQPVLIEYIMRNVEKVYNYIPFNRAKPNVVKATFGNDANLIGALYSYLH